MVEATPIHGLLLLLVVVKQTTEVSGNQTPGACSFVHVSGTCQSHFSPVQSLCKALRNRTELSCSTLPLLTLRFSRERSDANSKATPSLTDTPSAWAYSLNFLVVGIPCR
jgi:hypothetical protein